MSDASCPACGGPVVPKGAMGPRPTYCSSKCRSRASYLRRRETIRAEKLANAQARREQTIKACPSCGASFTPQRTLKQIFCSKLCERRANRDGSTTCRNDGCERRVRAKGLCVTHYNREFHPDSQNLYPGDPETRRRHLRIRTQRRRAAMKDPNAEKVDRDVVGERDCWRCGICQKRVDNRLAWPHPNSPSLDHVVPLSQGGEHTYANCRISHLDCNVQRSNNGGGEQLMLIG